MKGYKKIAIGLFISLTSFFIVSEIFHYYQWNKSSFTQQKNSFTYKINEAETKALMVQQKTVQRLNQLLSFWLDQHQKTGLEQEIIKTKGNESLLQVDYFAYNASGGLSKKISRGLNIEALLKTPNRVELKEGLDYEWKIKTFESKKYLSLIFRTQAQFANQVTEDGVVVAYFKKDLFAQIFEKTGSQRDFYLTSSEGLIFQSKSGRYFNEFLQEKNKLKSLVKKPRKQIVKTSQQLLKTVRLGQSNLYVSMSQKYKSGWLDYMSLFFLPLVLLLLGAFLLGGAFLTFVRPKRSEEMLHQKESAQLIELKQVINKLEEEKGLLNQQLESYNKGKQEHHQKVEENLEKISNKEPEEKYNPLVAIRKKAIKEVKPPRLPKPVVRETLRTSRREIFRLSKIIAKLKEDYVPRSVREKFLFIIEDFQSDYQLNLNYSQMVLGVETLVEFLIVHSRRYDHTLSIRIKKVEQSGLERVALEFTVDHQFGSHHKLIPFMLLDVPSEWEKLTLLKTSINAIGGEVFWNGQKTEELTFSLQFTYDKEYILETEEDILKIPEEFSVVSLEEGIQLPQDIGSLATSESSEKKLSTEKQKDSNLSGTKVEEQSLDKEQKSSTHAEEFSLQRLNQALEISSESQGVESQTLIVENESSKSFSLDSYLPGNKIRKPKVSRRTDVN